MSIWPYVAAFGGVVLVAWTATRYQNGFRDVSGTLGLDPFDQVLTVDGMNVGKEPAEVIEARLRSKERGEVVTVVVRRHSGREEPLLMRRYGFPPSFSPYASLTKGYV